MNVAKAQLKIRSKTRGARAACATGFRILYLIAPSYLHSTS